MIFKFLKKNFWILLILVIGLFLRLYKPMDFYIYNHDGDLVSWVIKDILTNKHLRLIGQETSVKGVFIGALFYYLLIPFYKLTSMDPIGGVYLSSLLGIFSIFSFYWVFTKVFNKKVGLIASFIYAVSFYTVLTDREVVPTTPAMLWSVWFFYATYLILKGKQKWGFILSSILISLIWHINLALILVLPLLPVALLVSKKKINFKYLATSLILLFVISSPFVLFEVRHNFQQTKAIIASLVTQRNYIQGTSTGLGKINRVFQLVYKNTSGILWGTPPGVSQKIALYLFLFAFVFLIVKKVISKETILVFSLWQTIYIIFFTFNSLNLSEYYLNGMNIVWIGVMALFLGYLIEKRKVKILGFLLLFLFTGFNLFRFFTYKPNQIGYRQKKEMVRFIKEDAYSHNYPCISISYITDPGYELGYRYFYLLENLHVNQPKSGSPVYTIVFPHTKVDRIDKSFGALGLILPDYKRYKLKEVGKSCSGLNANLTDPLFGYTE